MGEEATKAKAPLSGYRGYAILLLIMATFGRVAICFLQRYFYSHTSGNYNPHDTQVICK